MHFTTSPLTHMIPTYMIRHTVGFFTCAVYVERGGGGGGRGLWVAVDVLCCFFRGKEHSCSVVCEVIEAAAMANMAVLDQYKAGQSLNMQCRVQRESLNSHLNPLSHSFLQNSNL